MDQLNNINIHSLSDEEIVQRIVDGEQHLFENLMRKFNELVQD